MESGGSKVLWSPNKFCDVSFKLSIEISGADTQNRTGDLILTKDALYHLSYISMPIFVFRFFLKNLKNKKLKPGDVLLSHGETPHYHRRCFVSLLSSGWSQVGPKRYGRQANSFSLFLENNLESCFHSHTHSYALSY